MKNLRLPFVFCQLCIVFCLLLLSCGGSDVKTASGKKDKYEETKETLAETEKKNPVRFLQVSGGDKRNLIGQTVVKGTITNTATVATFKDIQVELYFYSKTGTLLEKDLETIFETLGPGKTTEFKTKYFTPKGTDSVGLKVLGAKSE
jgi:hypothetical protein